MQPVGKRARLAQTVEPGFASLVRRVHGVIYDTSHETPIFETVWLRQRAP